MPLFDFIFGRKSGSGKPRTAAEVIGQGLSSSGETSCSADKRAMTRYFLRTLKEADLKAPEFKDARTGTASRPFIEVPLRSVDEGPSIEAGRLSEADAKALYQVHRDRARGNGGGRSKAGERGIGVLISLATLYDASATRGAYTSLLVMPAVLKGDGSLEPDAENMPWINIERMHREGVPDEELMVGGADALRRYWSFVDREGKRSESNAREWKDWLAYAHELFSYVTGSGLDVWAKEKKAALNPDADSDAEGAPISIITDRCLVVQEELIIASYGIQKLYRYLDEVDRLPDLYSRFLETAESRRSIASTELAGAISAGFTGTMSDKFSLTDSQRIAVRAFCADGEGDITAVAGPPGTGKTTMLQAIVATTMVNHALAQKSAPVIVGTSTNNQAVTNIISSFASVTKSDPAILEHRWIIEAPDDLDADFELEKPLESLAVYCPSGAKEREARKMGYLLERYKGKTGVYRRYSDPDYMDRARPRFLEFASRALDEEYRSAGAVKKALLRKMTKIDDACRGLVDAYRTYLGGEGDGAPYLRCIERLKGLGALGMTERRAVEMADAFRCLVVSKGGHGIDRARSMDDLDKLLDITVRYVQFWLAVHYYEAEWVVLDEDNSFLEPRDLQGNAPDAMETYWRHAAALTPCFVMTEYQIPKWMSLYTKESGSHYDLGRIDLLIVDEAGQVDTCVGAAAFSLSKRAVVVGDENQLSPVWGTDSEIDQQHAQGMELGGAWGIMAERGLTCSKPSSVMRAACHAGRWSYGPTKDGEVLPGLFLAEHFRCHPLIINYCNELIYGGMLRPRRPMPASVIDELARRSAEGKPLDGEPENSVANDAVDDRGRSKAYRLLGIVSNPLLFVRVEGSKSRRVGSSRQNPAEAEAIAEWIRDNGPYFADVYGKSVGETIAVVTPFSAQAKCISRGLSKLVGSSANQSIVVGTAHRLQGAERPIVLFSCVYGDNDPSAPFIDDTLELMNVAVSRAKDLFIVFGGEARWKDRGTAFHLVHKLAEKSDAKFESGSLERPRSRYADSDGASRANSGAAMIAESASPASGAPARARMHKVYLNVPYAQKDEAKALGAQWDAGEGLWYVREGADLTHFAGFGIYLSVPYEEKDSAKLLGAKWDHRKRRWYVPANEDIEPLRCWLV